MKTIYGHRDVVKFVSGSWWQVYAALTGRSDLCLNSQGVALG